MGGNIWLSFFFFFFLYLQDFRYALTGTALYRFAQKITVNVDSWIKVSSLVPRGRKEEEYDSTIDPG